MRQKRRPPISEITLIFKRTTNTKHHPQKYVLHTFRCTQQNLADFHSAAVEIANNWTRLDRIEMETATPTEQTFRYGGIQTQLYGVVQTSSHSSLEAGSKPADGVSAKYS